MRFGRRRRSPLALRLLVTFVAFAAFVSLAAGCAAGRDPTVHLRKETGFDGAWVSTKDKRVAALDATGDVTKLRFGDRIYTFRGLTRFHGYINPDSVRLLTDSYVIELTPEQFSIEGRRRKYVRPITALPESPVIVFEGGNFFLE